MWGGYEGGDVFLGDGGHYDPVADEWTPTATVGAPAARGLHSAVWTGQEMIVWGGTYDNSPNLYYANGYRYWCDPI